ncbi:MAG: hypothetical protein J5722_03805, partial [Oscillospiraceae bacterium]|nr:hypothetical protein [Oscillospiraceae bacterium]
DDYIVFARYRKHRRKAMVIALNRSDHEVHFGVDKTPFTDRYTMFDVIHGDIQGNDVKLPPYGFAAVKVEL